MELLYRDGCMVVCLKPAGVLSEDSDKPCVPALLRQETGGYVGTVHRLDRVVGGVMVYCINEKLTGKLTQSFHENGEKTYLAVVMATQALKNGHVKRIILTRPAVEAGESLGFLPGDLKEKVDPYLRPLYDALHDIYGMEQTQRLIERGTIEIAPLAYMRGRTLDDAFVILDEAQNTTHQQMKMFLTRLGFGSKMIITGDKTQIDLPKNQESGLIIAERTLKYVKDIHFQILEQGDVVRHPLVARVIQAYAEQEL